MLPSLSDWAVMKTSNVAEEQALLALPLISSSRNRKLQKSRRVVR
jgi:hypothetical protein